MKEDIAIKVENVSKQYRLGVLGTGTLSHDLNRWWHLVRGKEDPYLKVGESNDRSTKGDSEYVWALKDINFEVKRGEVLGIIGKNGAGKSTLLKLLAKVTTPTSGEILMKGRVASLLEVGTGFHPELTGKENIYLNGAILGMTKNEINKKLDEIIDFSGCERYIDTPVKRYSSGMKVRLAFAVAAFLEPEILIVDEVLAVGDAEFQKKAMGKMQDVSSEGGRTVLFVSHNMYSIRQLCNSAVILDKGMIALSGDVEMCIEYYLNRSDNKDKSVYIDPLKLEMAKCNEFCVEKIEVINNSYDGEEIRSGDNITFRFHYKFFERVYSLGFEIRFIDSFNQKITSFKTNPDSGFFIDTIEGIGYIDLNINQITLTDGNYYIDLRTYKRLSKTFFKVESLIELNIKPQDVFKTGCIIDNKTGMFWMNHSWNNVNK